MVTILSKQSKLRGFGLIAPLKKKFMGVAQKILSMKNDGFTVGFSNSKTGDQFISLIVKKNGFRLDFDITEQAFQTDNLLISVLSDAQEDFQKSFSKLKK